jgi:hypothetical protein
MGRLNKLGNLRGVREWQHLESAGDVKRLLKWLILSIREQTLDPKVGAIMAQIGAFMLKATEVADFEQPILALEKRLASEGEKNERT